MESDGFKVLDMLQTVDARGRCLDPDDALAAPRQRRAAKVTRAAPRIGEHSAAIREEFGL